MRFGDLDSRSRSVLVARAFFHAATKLSEDDEDILPQEDSSDVKLSVYGLFAELFPEHVVSKECGSITAKTGLTRLQFNKLGYEMYVKEQSRRVPAPRAKPGNPGYGFRRAKWRNTSDGAEDQGTMQETLQAIGLPRARCDYVRMRVDQVRLAWEQARRPSRPAGPGRPRGRSRGDKAEDNSPEPGNYESLKPSYDAYVDSPKGQYSGATLPSPMSAEPSGWQYAQQMEHVTALRSAFGWTQQQQQGLSSPLPTVLLPQQRSFAVPQQLMPALQTGMSAIPLSYNASSGGCWTGNPQPQQPSPAGINWGLLSAPHSPIAPQTPFAPDTLSKIHQQLLKKLLVSSERGALCSFQTGASGQAGQAGQAGSASLPAAVSAGAAPGSAGSAGCHADLQHSVQACAVASSFQAPRQYGDAGSSKRHWGADNVEVQNRSEDEEDEDDVAAAAAAGSRRDSKQRRIEVSSTVGSESCSAAAEKTDKDKDGGEIARLLSQASSRPQMSRECSSSALSSSASTSVATSPASRALDKMEHTESLHGSSNNKASLTNLLTG